jgi:hypothetical protein
MLSPARNLVRFPVKSTAAMKQCRLGKVQKLVPRLARLTPPIAPSQNAAANTLHGTGQAPDRGDCWLAAPLRRRFGLLIGRPFLFFCDQIGDDYLLNAPDNPFTNSTVAYDGPGAIPNRGDEWTRAWEDRA